MKRFAFLVFTLASSLSMLGSATAKTTYIKPFSAKVNYSCQQGKRVAVNYNFNRYGLPTSASAYLNGSTRYMLRNSDESDNVDTFFGKEGVYNMATSYMDSRNYRQISGINIFSPTSKMLYKDCSPR